MTPPDVPALRRYPELDGKTFLIGVGAMRSATSWVSRYLAARDGVVVSPLKELHFFNAKFPRWSIIDMERFAISRLRYIIDDGDDPVARLRDGPMFQASLDRAKMIYDDNEYFAHFARLCGPDTRTFCDITPAYAPIGVDGFAYIKAFCATQAITPRLLFIMRDPVERLWSQFRWMTQIEPDLDLATDWQTLIARRSMAARAAYRITIEALDAVFEPGEILYLFYETLFTEPSLRQLCAFAGVEFGPADTQTLVNASTSDIAMPEAARDGLRELLAPQYAFCRKRFGTAIPAQWLD